MFEKMYFDDSEQSWDYVSEEEVKRQLRNYYLDVDEIIREMKKTPVLVNARSYWAVYRWNPSLRLQ